MPTDSDLHELDRLAAERAAALAAHDAFCLERTPTSESWPGPTYPQYEAMNRAWEAFERAQVAWCDGWERHGTTLIGEVRRLRAERADLEAKAAELAAGAYAEWGLDTMRCVTVLVQDECWRKQREIESLRSELAVERQTPLPVAVARDRKVCRRCRTPYGAETRGWHYDFGNDYTCAICVPFRWEETKS